MKSTGRGEARLLRIIHTQNEIASSDLDLRAVMQVAADHALECHDLGTVRSMIGAAVQRRRCSVPAGTAA